MFSFKRFSRMKSEEACILSLTAPHSRTLAVGSVHQVKCYYYYCRCVQVKLIENCFFFFLRSTFSSPLIFFFFSSLLHLFSPPCHRTVRSRDVAAAHQHTVGFESCVPPSLPLCDAISDYIVITHALGACSQPSLSRTWAKLFREHCFQVWIYMGVKCYRASVAQTRIFFCHEIWS